MGCEADLRSCLAFSRAALLLQAAVQLRSGLWTCARLPFPINDLSASLVVRDGRVVSQRQLLKDVWGPAHTDQAHYLRVYMGTLRRKLEQDPARPRYLLTEPGVGYRLAAE